MMETIHYLFSCAFLASHLTNWYIIICGIIHQNTVAPFA